MKPAPQTLAEALDVIRAMHHDLLAFRNPEFDLITPGCEGEFDDRVKAVLAHSAPVIKADRTDLLPEASPDTKGQCNDERACGACYSGQGQCENAAKTKHRVRIEGDGTSASTRIVDATTGETLRFVQGYTVTQRVGKIAKAVIEVALPQISLECEAEIVTVPIAAPIDTTAPILRPDSDNDTD